MENSKLHALIAAAAAEMGEGEFDESLADKYTAALTDDDKLAADIAALAAQSDAVLDALSRPLQ